MKRRQLRVVSGGQTGVDRAALEVAAFLEIEHGGWCPLGRLAEDGPIPDRFSMRETDTADYAVRTRWNVRDSDATLIIARQPLSGGTALTAGAARDFRRPLLVLDPLGPESELASALEWLNGQDVQVLNVAGPRESSQPGIGQLAEQLLLVVFRRWALETA
jgi:Circularly permutated YpsA SLOG family